jgi:hypothetical protein
MVLVVELRDGETYFRLHHMAHFIHMPVYKKSREYRVGPIRCESFETKAKYASLKLDSCSRHIET